MALAAGEGPILSVALFMIELMFERLKPLVGELERLVGQLDPKALDPRAAVRVVEIFSKGEKLCAAGKALASARVAETGEWRKNGDRTPAQFIAKATGDSVGTTITLIETARRMEELPQAEAAFRSGRLTPQAAAEVASAASVAPQKQNDLLTVAEAQGIEKLRQVARQVKAQHDKDQAERAERLHRSRYLRTWSEGDGAFRLDARLAPEAGAEVKAVLDTFREDEFRSAQRQKRTEPYQALAADALVSIARAAREGGGGNSIAPKAVMNLVADAAALSRGYLEPGETCEARGVGPIPVTAALSFLPDSLIRVIAKNGNKIEEVVNAGRYIPARLATAVRNAYPECAVNGCHETRGLEIDHVKPVGQRGETKLDNLVRLCSHHHRLKTYKKWTLKPEGHGWVLLPPKKSRDGPW